VDTRDHEEWSPVGAVQTGDIGEIGIAAGLVDGGGEDIAGAPFHEAPLAWSSGEKSKTGFRRDEVTHHRGGLWPADGDEGGRGEVNLAGWGYLVHVVSMSKVSRNLANEVAAAKSSCAMTGRSSPEFEAAS